MAVRLGKHYKSKIFLENEDGVAIATTVLIARIDPAQAAEFQANWHRLNNAPSNKLLGGRRPNGNEQEKNDKNEYLISDFEVERRRLAELEGEAKAAYEKADREDEVWARSFIQSSIEEYITAPAGEIVDVDGAVTEPGGDVTTGAHLVRFFASNGSVLRDLVTAIWMENTLSPHQKKAWKSLSAFGAGLIEVAAAVAPGTTPAPTAESVKPAASAATAPVTASSETNASGSADATEPSR